MKIRGLAWAVVVTAAFAGPAFADSSADLFEGVRYGDVEKVRSALDRRAKPDEMDSHGETALIKAADLGLEDIVRLLLERRAKVNRAAKQSKKTPLMFPAAKGHAGIVRLLLDSKADVNAADKGGRRPCWRPSLRTAQRSSNCFWRRAPTSPPGSRGRIGPV